VEKAAVPTIITCIYLGKCAPPPHWGRSGFGERTADSYEIFIVFQRFSRFYKQRYSGNPTVAKILDLL